MTNAGTLLNAGRAAVILAGALTLGQAATIARDLFVAAQVGLSANLDALLIAAAVPLTLTGIVASGPQAALITALTELKEEKGESQARRFAGSVLLYLSAASLVLSIVIWTAAPAIIALVGAGLGQTERPGAINFLRVMALWVTFGTVAAILTAVFQAAGRFSLLSLAWVVGPPASMLVTLALWSSMGLTAYALGLTIASGVTAAALVGLSLRAGIFPPLGHGNDVAQWRALARHAVPMSAGTSLQQLNPLIQRIVASFIAPGAVSALRYGDLIARIPHYAALPAWTAVAYPTLAKAKRESGDGLGRTAEAAIRYALAGSIPVAWAMAAFAPLIVDIAFGRGAMTPSDLRTVTLVVLALAPLLIAYAAQPVLVGAHNAHRRGAFLGVAGALNVVGTAVFSIAFGFTLGVGGVALASSVGAILTVLLLAGAIRDIGFSARRIAVTAVRIVAVTGLIAVPAALFAWWVHPVFAWPVELALVLLLGSACLAVYLAVARRAGIDEIPNLVGAIRHWRAYPDPSADSAPSP
jgi:putative peptidoglycan lipid II flippase